MRRCIRKPPAVVEEKLRDRDDVFEVEQPAEQHLDGGEDIEVYLVHLDELLTMVRRGEFPHALQVAALFHVLAYLDRIR
jgi:hypothetical protein